MTLVTFTGKRLDLISQPLNFEATLYLSNRRVLTATTQMILSNLAPPFTRASPGLYRK